MMDVVEEGASFVRGFGGRIGYALGVHFMIYIQMYVIVGGGSGDVWDMFWGNEHVVRYV